MLQIVVLIQIKKKMLFTPIVSHVPKVYQNILHLWKNLLKFGKYTYYRTLLYLLIATKKVMYKICLYLRLKVQQSFE